MTGGGDVDPYVADSARDEVHALRDLGAQLGEWLDGAQYRIAATNAVRTDSFDMNYPNLEQAAEVAAELTQVIDLIDDLANAFAAAVDELEVDDDDAADGED